MSQPDFQQLASAQVCCCSSLCWHQKPDQRQGEHYRHSLECRLQELYGNGALGRTLETPPRAEQQDGLAVLLPWMLCCSPHDKTCAYPYSVHI